MVKTVPCYSVTPKSLHNDCDIAFINPWVVEGADPYIFGRYTLAYIIA